MGRPDSAAAARTAALAFLMLLAACGGGGDGAPVAPPAPPPPPPATPLAVADTASALWQQPITVDVLANDTVSAGTLSLAAVSAASLGTATVSNGRITYTAAISRYGTETLQYTLRADQGGATTTGTLTIAVRGRLTLQGTVSHASGAAAALVAHVGAASHAATADAQGRYTVDIESDSPDPVVRLDATAVAASGALKQRSYVSTFGALAERANGQAQVVAAAEPRLVLSAATTAQAVLALAAVNGAQPESAPQLRRALGLVDPEQWLDLTTVLAPMLDNSTPPPGTVSDTLQLTLANPAYARALYASVSPDPDAFSARKSALLAPLVAAAPPVPATASSERHVYFTGQCCLAEPGVLVEYRTDGTAQYCSALACKPSRWTRTPQALDIVFDQPIISQTTEFENGQPILVEYRTTGLRLRQVSINDQLVTHLRPTTKTFVQGSRAGETITWVDDTEPGTPLQAANLREVEPIGAAEFEVGRIWAGFRGEFAVPLQSANNPDQDVFRMLAGQRARSELTGLEYGLVVSGPRVLVSSPGGASHEYLRVRSNPHTGAQQWLAIGPTGAPGAGNDTARVDIIIPATLPSPVVVGWADTWANPPSALSMFYLEITTIGTATEQVWVSGTAPSAAPRDWAIVAPDTLEFARPPSVAVRRVRSWRPLSMSADAAWVHETLATVNAAAPASPEVTTRRIVRKQRGTAPWN